MYACLRSVCPPGQHVSPMCWQEAVHSAQCYVFWHVQHKVGLQHLLKKTFTYCKRFTNR